MTFTAVAPPGGVNNVNGTTSNFTVPAGVTSISFEVIGGAGGGASAYGVCRPGRVLGELTVTPGEGLTLTVGQGGYKASAPSGTTGTAGGGGYGSGGNSSITEDSGNATNYTTAPSGSGGGGSAILSGTTPLIVASGGGGQGQMINTSPPDQPTFDYSANGTSFNTLKQGVLGRTIWVGNGGAASGGTAGAGGNLNGATTEGGAFQGGVALPGNPGTAGPGGNGGNGIAATNQFNNHNGVSSRFHVSTGGGGGGFAGGGSGGNSRARWDTDPRTLVNVGGDGGQGSSFTEASRVSGDTTNTVGGRSGYNQRSPGSIVLTYTVCP